MSLVVTVYVPDGIVMAADSRLTLDFSLPQAAGAPKQYSVPSTDSNYKLFLVRDSVGVSTYGAASMDNKPIGPVVESFFLNTLPQAAVSPEDVAKALLAHFRAFLNIPPILFHVGGYKNAAQDLWLVDVGANTVGPINTTSPGAAWGGEADTLTRLLHKVGTLDPHNTVTLTLPAFAVAFNYWTLQDAIDFAVYAIRTTADTMRFQMRLKTVGGPIDVLVIKPKVAEWVKRKSLTVNDTQ